MILYISYEEVQAIRFGVHSFLSDNAEGGCAVAAPPAARAEVKALEERLGGDLGVDTLAEQRGPGLGAVIDRRVPPCRDGYRRRRDPSCP